MWHCTSPAFFGDSDVIAVTSAVQDKCCKVPLRPQAGESKHHYWPQLGSNNILTFHKCSPCRLVFLRLSQLKRLKLKLCCIESLNLSGVTHSVCER